MKLFSFSILLSQCKHPSHWLDSNPKQETHTGCRTFVIYLQKLLDTRLRVSREPWPWAELHCGTMGKVSSVNGGSLFRVKCVICGINPCPSLCPGWWLDRTIPTTGWLRFCCFCHTCEDLQDSLVEVVRLVSKDIVTSSSDHLRDTKTQPAWKNDHQENSLVGRDK